MQLQKKISCNKCRSKENVCADLQRFLQRRFNAGSILRFVVLEGFNIHAEVNSKKVPFEGKWQERRNQVAVKIIYWDTRVNIPAQCLLFSWISFFLFMVCYLQHTYKKHYENFYHYAMFLFPDDWMF